MFAWAEDYLIQGHSESLSDRFLDFWVAPATLYVVVDIDGMNAFRLGDIDVPQVPFEKKHLDFR